MSVGGTALPAPFHPHPRLTRPRAYSAGAAATAGRSSASRERPRWTTAAMMAPTIGARTYNQASLRLPVTIIGPNARAGLKAAPVSAPPIRMLRTKVRPIAPGPAFQRRAGQIAQLGEDAEMKDDDWAFGSTLGLRNRLGWRLAPPRPDLTELLGYLAVSAIIVNSGSNTLDCFSHLPGIDVVLVRPRALVR